MYMLEYNFENMYHEQGYSVICGVDEAGRGPLAGNVVAAAVIMPDGFYIDSLNDSKKLSEKKRNALFDIITKSCAYGIGRAGPAEIDEHNILGATMIAMRRAIEALPEPPSLALIDGNRAVGFPLPVVTIVGGDAKSPSIAAASIIAKVTRDRECLELDALYPQYGFAKHKGYPTAEHMAKVREIGPCPEHRRSFLSFLSR